MRRVGMTVTAGYGGHFRAVQGFRYVEGAPGAQNLADGRDRRKVVL